MKPMLKSYSNCLDAIQAAGRGLLSDDDIERMLSALQRTQDFLATRGKSFDVAANAVKTAEYFAQRLEEAAAVEQRNTAMNLAKRIERVQWVQKNFGNNFAEGIEALLVGVNRAKQGSRNGVAQIQHLKKISYMTGLHTDLVNAGTLEIFQSGALDREVANALWAIGRKDETHLLNDLPEAAVKTAQVVNKWQEIARLEANEAGAWIRESQGYIVKQTHDSIKIRGDGSEHSFLTWQEGAKRWFDLDRMMQNFLMDGGNNASVPEMLRAMWRDFSDGNHLKAIPDDQMAGYKGPSNLAKKISQNREVFFKDADAWFDYNQQYGTGNIREAVTQGLNRRAEAIGLMQTLGNNPKSMLETIKQDLTEIAKHSREQGGVNMSAQLNESKVRDKLDVFMAQVDGSANRPVDVTLARRMNSIRAWEMWSKLGGMMLAQLPDIAAYGAGTRYQGRGLFTGINEAIGGLTRNLDNAEVRDLAASLGVVLDNMAGELGQMGAFAEGGARSKMTELFMKLTGAKWWTDKMRTSASFGMSHHMALQAEKSFEGLSSEYQRVLGLYDITPEKWDIIRGVEAKAVDGKGYITPEAIRSVSDESIQPYSAKAGLSIEAARSQLEQNLLNYFVDQTGFMALEPDAKTRAYMYRGLQPGTKWGEGARFLLQFKSFIFAHIQKVLGRELYGRGYEGDSIVGALRHGNGEVTGLAQVILTSTIMGYASMTLKEVAKGRSPRDFTQSPDQAMKTFYAAMVQGGGAGIYGDFIFGESNRFGGGMLDTLAGPTVSAVTHSADIFHRMLRGESFGADLFREGVNNTPFMNLFYTKMAMDYMLIYGIQEKINPGYLGRMEQRVQKQNAQQFILPPSQHANRF